MDWHNCYICSYEGQYPILKNSLNSLWMRISFLKEHVKPWCQPESFSQTCIVYSDKKDKKFDTWNTFKKLGSAYRSAFYIKIGTTVSYSLSKRCAKWKLIFIARDQISNYFFKWLSEFRLFWRKCSARTIRPRKRGRIVRSGWTFFKGRELN